MDSIERSHARPSSALLQMCHLEKLERLVLSDNNLSDVPRLLAAFLRRLRVIDLSRNRFKRIPPVLAALTGLQSVDLSGNADLEACPLSYWIIAITPTIDEIGRLLCRASLTLYEVVFNRSTKRSRRAGRS